MHACSAAPAALGDPPVLIDSSVAPPIAISGSLNILQHLATQHLSVTFGTPDIVSKAHEACVVSCMLGFLPAARAPALQPPESPAPEAPASSTVCARRAQALGAALTTFLLTPGSNAAAAASLLGAQLADVNNALRTPRQASLLSVTADLS